MSPKKSLLNTSNLPCKLFNKIFLIKKRELEKFNKTNIFEWLKFLRENCDDQLDNQSIIDNLNMLFHTFFIDQKDKGSLLKYKKDYF